MADGKLKMFKPLDFTVNQTERAIDPNSFSPRVKVSVTFSMSIEELENMALVGQEAYLPDLYEKLEKYYEMIDKEKSVRGNV